KNTKEAVRKAKHERFSFTASPRCKLRWAQEIEEVREMSLAQRTYRTLAPLWLLLIAAGCGQKSAEAEVAVKADTKAATETTTEATAGADALVEAETIVEEHDGGSVAWNVGTDGKVKALVKGPDNKPIRENVSAALVWKAGAEPVDVPLNL